MKSKKRYAVLVALLCAALTAGGILPAYASGKTGTAAVTDSDMQDEIDQAGSDLDELESELGDIKDEHNALSKDKKKAQDYLNSLTSQASKLEDQLSGIQEQIQLKEQEIADKELLIQETEKSIADMETLLAETESAITSGQEDLDEQYESMKLRIQYMYENSSAMAFLERLMRSDSLASLLNNIEYINQIITYDRKMTTKFEEDQQKLVDLKNSLETQKAALETNRETLIAETKELENGRKELADMNTQLASQQKEVNYKKQASASELQQYIDELARANAKIDDYEDLIHVKKEYYDELLAQKKKQEEAAAKKDAENAANDTNGSITVGDSGIDHTMTVNASEEDLLLLSAIIYCEAGGESYEGQLAVGYVIMNRVRSKLFPNTISGVVYQKNQFSPAGSGRLATVLAMEMDPDVKGVVTDSCRRAAREVIDGTSNVGDSLFFRTWKPVPQLVENLKNNNIPYQIIGNHIFYYRWIAYNKPVNPTTAPTTEAPTTAPPTEAPTAAPTAAPTTEAPATTAPPATEPTEAPSDSSAPSSSQKPSESSSQTEASSDAESLSSTDEAPSND